ncbi:MAG: hypothetical protein AAEJ04_01180 [Planctomycetota bacterium]
MPTMRCSKLKTFLLATLLLSLPSWGNNPAIGQVVLHTDDQASSGSNTAHNMVRDTNGDLYVLSLERTANAETRLIVQRSTDGGTNWTTLPQNLNDADSGLIGPDPASHCSLAIDDQGVLHVLWGRYTYPSYFRQFYRRYNPTTGFRSDIVEISVLTSAPLNSRTSAMDIVIDSNNTVWIASHHPSSWVDHLLRSDQPYAADDTFTDLGSISPANSAQNTRLAVDTLGRIHCSFYRNTGQGQYEHRIYDPISGWQVDTFVLGNTDGTNDFYGWISSDNLGAVHCAYVVDAFSASPLWSFRYRMWDDINGWSDETTLFEATNAQFTNIASYKIFNLGCDETNGTVYAIYRDLSTGGELVLAEKTVTSPDFSVTQQLQQPSLGQHVYSYPTLRGTLYPDFNNTSHGLDITYQWRELPGVPPYSLIYHDGSMGTVIRFIRGDANQDGSYNVADIVFGLNSLFVPGGVTPACIESCDINDDGSFNIADMVYGLNSLFVPGSPPPESPYPGCGADPEAATLDCPSSSPACP